MSAAEENTRGSGSRMAAKRGTRINNTNKVDFSGAKIGAFNSGNSSSKSTSESKSSSSSSAGKDMKKKVMPKGEIKDTKKGEKRTKGEIKRMMKIKSLRMQRKEARRSGNKKLAMKLSMRIMRVRDMKAVRPNMKLMMRINSLRMKRMQARKSMNKKLAMKLSMRIMRIRMKAKRIIREE